VRTPNLEVVQTGHGVRRQFSGIDLSSINFRLMLFPRLDASRLFAAEHGRPRPGTPPPPGDDRACSRPRAAGRVEGDRDGAFSIRIDRQWRICFAWPAEADAPAAVEITDYH
jgi:hypothetical protein